MVRVNSLAPLWVTAEDSVVGELSYDGMRNQYGFRYDDAWLARQTAFPLSLHFPLTEKTDAAEALASPAIARFMENLLPEGRALDVAASSSKISKSNVFGLIRLLGKEPVGALSFLADTDLVKADEPNTRRVIGHEELSQRIRDRDAIPFPLWDGKVRLSVAGYQDKLQVMVEGDRLSLVDGPGISSTHILKPDSPNPTMPHLAANEHFCMTLARHLGLPVAPVRMLRVPEPVLLIERFDRLVERVAPGSEEIGRVRRRHVIDGCQALDLPVSFKYERPFGHGAEVGNIRDGASFEKLFALSQHFEAPAVGRIALTQWALLQLLIGNGDAHAKNISFFQQRSRIALAPFYDLVCVQAYGDKVEQEMAMAFGDVFRMEEITPYCLADFGQRIGAGRAFLGRELARLAQRCLQHAPMLVGASAYVGEEKVLVHQVCTFICRNAQRLLKLAPAIGQVDPHML